MQGQTKPTPAKMMMNPYLRQQIQTASPEKCIQILYDIGIKSCQTEDRNMAANAVIELMNALNFDYENVAMSYYRLYRYALDQIHRNNFKDATLVLREMREMWQSVVMKKHTQPVG